MFVKCQPFCSAYIVLNDQSIRRGSEVMVTFLKAAKVPSREVSHIVHKNLTSWQHSCTRAICRLPTESVSTHSSCHCGHQSSSATAAILRQCELELKTRGLFTWIYGLWLFFHIIKNRNRMKWTWFNQCVWHIVTRLDIKAGPQVDVISGLINLCGCKLDWASHFSGWIHCYLSTIHYL